MKKALLALLCAITAWPACATIVIYGTRIIYPAQRQEITVQLANRGDKPSLIQAWIDEGDPNVPPEEVKAPFLLTPPIATVTAGNGQQLRIRALPNALPQDRESLFYLNVIDIPPDNPARSGNLLKLAMQNRIKLFYRPQGIAELGEKTVGQLSARRDEQRVTLNNRSPNHITITALGAGEREQLLKATLMLAPFSQRHIAVAGLPGGVSTLTLSYLNDYGVKRQQAIPLN
ncbi:MULTISPECIES: fimbrial biogenesis chaperone [Edwardsiella]|uniref:Gram-negative pili assembly chaperone, putative n=2 Tax=Edwardsiella anguillarum TaxID=1821960 RepID=A0A076LET5_9GAMM|nr:MULTISPECIES: fimbria/pilus periplasmic chaperone [Edwardsiella]AIJ06701.1 gram-negative pili assembly chaperone, putative [Edwardsiella anguillarum ET080813]AKR78204.1 fimbria/pilus periplasmic chaperone [Edwardsiella sp. LADL05-105]KAB0593328.1 fimbria/pilus periplasmic chaperone [Edwardsiella anguillarum]UOU77894.1 fimbria/pilus periplasmic chaperone [Edwardsiella anguillarum]WHP82608.1 fimbria/pilus periplasmic chaperone [Edwardsiella anguillarum]